MNSREQVWYDVKMLRRIKEDSELGFQIVRKGVKDLIRRSIEETEFIKIRLGIRRKEKELDDIMLRTGKLFFEKLIKGECSLEDPDLKSLFLTALRLKEDIEILKTDLSERLTAIPNEDIKKSEDNY